MTSTLPVRHRCTLHHADETDRVLFGRIAVEAGLAVRPVGPPRWTRRAVRDGRLVGFCAVSGGFAPGTVPAPDLLFVHHAARRSGVGRALVEDLQVLLHRDGLAALDVLAHPAAEMFFRAVGARQTGVVPPGDGVAWCRPRFVVACRSG